jgi:hypothetical protein
MSTLLLQRQLFLLRNNHRASTRAAFSILDASSTTRASSSSSSTTTISHHKPLQPQKQQQQQQQQHERLLVLGSGVAGCATALTAARHGIPVTILHAGSDRTDCNSYWAQGGVIYRNYRLLKDNHQTQGGQQGQQQQQQQQGGSNNVSSSNSNGRNDGRAGELADTPLSLVNDIRIASGYQGPLQQLLNCVLIPRTNHNNCPAPKHALYALHEFSMPPLSPHNISLL